MAIDQTFSVSLLRGTQNVSTQAVKTSTETELNSDVALGVVTDHALGIAFTLANLKSLYIYADKDCTFKTNSTGTPQETVTVKAGIPLVWYDQMPLVTTSELFGGNVTEVYVTTTAATNFKWYSTIHAP